MDVSLAWKKFINKIEEIKKRQDVVIARFLEVVTERKLQRIRKKIK